MDKKTDIPDVHSWLEGSTFNTSGRTLTAKEVSRGICTILCKYCYHTDLIFTSVLYFKYFKNLFFFVICMSRRSYGGTVSNVHEYVNIITGTFFTGTFFKYTNHSCVHTVFACNVYTEQLIRSYKLIKQSFTQSNCRHNCTDGSGQRENILQTRKGD